MEFTNEFTIPLPIDEAFAVLTDLEKVAPCMPGATLTEVDGDTYTGRVKVKVGPMSLTYQGDATLTESDPEAHTARIEASGREKRGAGTASADVAASLVAHGDQTRVTVTTDINITGKPAQFGRGVMADVGGKIIDRFATNLQEMLEEDQSTPDPEPAPSGVSDDAAATPVASAAAAPAATAPAPAAASTGPRKVTAQAPRDEALDLMDVAGEATAKRLAPVAAAVLALVLLVLWRRGRGD